MALTRKMLKAMGLEDEKIDQIIEAHTETVDGLKESLEKAQAAAKALPGVQKELVEAKVSLEAAKDSSWKDAHDKVKKEFDEYKAGVAAKEAKAAKEAAVRAYYQGKGITGKALEIAMRGSGTEIEALELGADGIINGAQADAVEEVRKLTDGKGCDLAVETAGTQITTVQMIHMTKKGATIVLVGYSKSGEMTLPMSFALDKELTFKTVFRYRHIYPMAIEAVAAGKVNLKGIVTDVFGLDEAQKAMDYSVNNKADIVKAVIRIAE